MIVITGPTASGKSGLAVELAKKFNGEIVSADSMQIYRGCNIGTGKITAEEMCRIPHHLLDVAEPSEDFTAFDFRRLADEAISGIVARKKVPIIVGGTGFYLRTLLFDLSLGAEPSMEIRAKYEKLLAEQGIEALYKTLCSIDNESAEKIHPNDTKRIIRALEIFDATGMKKSEIKNGSQLRYSNYVMFSINMERERLYSRIDQRVDKMVAAGLVKEAEELIKYREFNSMQAIGYKEIFEYLDGKLSLNEAVSLLKQNSRNYAKRQITFIKGFNIKEFDITKEGSMSDIIQYIVATMPDITQH